jgi:cytidylate kinase
MTKTRSIQQIVEEQIHRWQILQKEEQKQKTMPVVTVSREPGSGGRIIAEMLAIELKMDIFHQDMIHQMAESAHVHRRFFEMLDEKGMNLLEEWISSLVNDHHLWPDEYLKHLMKLVNVIGKYGGAVIVGRGANFILPHEKCLRVRVIAPKEIRVENVSHKHGVSPEEAKRRIVRTESDRRAFVRKYYNADIDNPLNYDLVLNTGNLSIEASARTIRGALGM